MTRVLGTLALVFGAACARTSSRPAALTDDAGVPIRIGAPARRVVSLIPATTELLFALGAGDRVVGRTTWCDYPDAAARIPDLGNGIGPNVEAVLAARPDLVLLYRSSANAAAADRLRSMQIPVLELRTDRIADLYRVAGLLGRVLGISAAADSLIGWVHRDIVAATPATPPSPPTPPTILLLSWKRPPIVLGRGSFLSEIVDLAGGRNVFEDLPVPSAPVSIEAVARRDPDFILTTALEMPEITGLPEWQPVRAVRERRFLRVRGSEFNRPSPRIGMAIRELRAALDSARR